MEIRSRGENPNLDGMFVGGGWDDTHDESTLSAPYVYAPR